MSGSLAQGEPGAQVKDKEPFVRIYLADVRRIRMKGLEGPRHDMSAHFVPTIQTSRDLPQSGVLMLAEAGTIQPHEEEESKEVVMPSNLAGIARGAIENENPQLTEIGRVKVITVRLRI